MGGDWKEMFQASCDGDIELLRFHVGNGVDVNYVHPEYLSTPLVACILAGRADSALFLLDSGADPAALSELDGLTPLQAAHSIGLTPVLERLDAMGVR